MWVKKPSFCGTEGAAGSSCSEKDVTLGCEQYVFAHRQSVHVGWAAGVLPSPCCLLVSSQCQWHKGCCSPEKSACFDRKRMWEMIHGAGAQGSHCVPPLPCPGLASYWLRVFQKSSALPSPGLEIGKNMAVPALLHCFHKGRLSLPFCVSLWATEIWEPWGRWAQWPWAQWPLARTSLPKTKELKCFSSRALVFIHHLELQFFLSNKRHCPNALWGCAQCVYNSLLCLCPWGKV